ncbi:MAG: hypothetical protein ACP5HM_16755 [Anaerolineae bacterium]
MKRIPPDLTRRKFLQLLAASGEMVIMHRAKFKGTATPEDRNIKTWPV